MLSEQNRILNNDLDRISEDLRSTKNNFARMTVEHKEVQDRRISLESELKSIKESYTKISADRNKLEQEIRLLGHLPDEFQSAKHLNEIINLGQSIDKVQQWWSSNRNAGKLFFYFNDQQLNHLKVTFSMSIVDQALNRFHNQLLEIFQNENISTQVTIESGNTSYQVNRKASISFN